MTYAPAYPHDPIEAIADDVFMVRGSIRMNAVMRITRNMAIVRHQGELTLVDPIRLSDAGEARLRELGASMGDWTLGATGEFPALAPASRGSRSLAPIVGGLVALGAIAALAIALESMPEPLSDEDYRAGSITAGGDGDQDEKNRINTH